MILSRKYFQVYTTNHNAPCILLKMILCLGASRPHVVLLPHSFGRLQTSPLNGVAPFTHPVPTHEHLDGFQSFVFTSNTTLNILAHLSTHTLVKFLEVEVLRQREYAFESLGKIFPNYLKSNYSNFSSHKKVKKSMLSSFAQFSFGLHQIFIWGREIFKVLVRTLKKIRNLAPYLSCITYIPLPPFVLFFPVLFMAFLSIKKFKILM